MATVLADLMLRLRSNSAELNRGVEQSKKSITSLDKKTKSMSKNSTKSFKDMQKSAGGAFGSIAGSMGAIGPAGTSAVGGFQAMAVAAKALNVALGPIGWIILAIGIALKALTSFFKGSVDGAGELAKIMGYLKGIIQVIQDAFIRLGRFIVEAFKSPKESIEKLWEAIKQNLVNRWEGLIEFFKSSFELLKNGFKGLALLVKSIFDKDAREEATQYFDAMKEDIVEVGKAAVKMSTGFNVEKIIKWGKTIIEELDRVADAMEKLEKRAFALKLKGIKLIKTEADDRKKISELIFISSDKENETLKVRLAATKEAGKIEIASADRKIAQAEEALAIQQETMGLGEDSVEDKEKEAQLYADLIKLQIDRNNRLREYVNREEEIQGSIRATGVEYINMTQADAQAESKRVAAEKKGIEDAAAAKIKLEQDAAKSLSAYKISINEETEAGALANLKARLDAGLILEEEHAARVLDIKKKFAQEAADFLKEKEQEEADAAADALDIRDENLQRFFNATLTGLDAVSTFQEAAKNKELAAAEGDERKMAQIEKKYAKKQKRTAATKAIIGTALAVINALQTIPFLPMGPIMAAAAAAAGGAQIALIASQSFQHGGIVGGGSSFGDRTLIRANAGEMILSKGQQSNLFKMLNTRGRGGGKVVFSFENGALTGQLEYDNIIDNAF